MNHNLHNTFTSDLTVIQDRLLASIARRGLRVLTEAGLNIALIDVILDLEYCHKVEPLDFAVLDCFDAGNFAHDIIGIYVNFNRDTKQLDNCFLPRCAVANGAGQVATIMDTLKWNPEVIK